MRIKRAVLCLVAASMVLISSYALADSSALVTSFAGLGANDSAGWAQFGGDGTFLPPGTTATSLGGIFVAIVPGGESVSVQCPAAPTCSWNGGFTPGDSLISTFGSFFPASLGFGFGSQHVTAAGLSLQAQAPSPFTALAVVRFADFTFSPLYSLNSDANGDPLFLGIKDLSGRNIVGMAFQVKISGSNTNFAADTLYINSKSVAPTPEPASLLLMGTGLLGLGCELRRRFARS